PDLDSLSLHDALPIYVTLYAVGGGQNGGPRAGTVLSEDAIVVGISGDRDTGGLGGARLSSDQTSVDVAVPPGDAAKVTQAASAQDRKSTRLNSSHVKI